jgi:hypothetical protein
LEPADERQPMSARDWIAAYAEKLGTAPPSNEEFELILELAGVAAHSSQRVAAPVACWVAAGAGASPQDALSAAHGIEA